MPSPRQIIMIEDNDSDAYLLNLALEKHLDLPYKIKRIDDGEDALTHLKRIDAEVGALPDLFVVDLNLPKISGHQLVEYIRGSQRLTSIPIAVVTSSNSPSDRKVLDRFTISAYLLKPVDLDEFIELGRVLSSCLQP